MRRLSIGAGESSLHQVPQASRLHLKFGNVADGTPALHRLALLGEIITPLWRVC